MKDFRLECFCFYCLISEIIHTCSVCKDSIYCYYYSFEIIENQYNVAHPERGCGGQTIKIFIKPYQDPKSYTILNNFLQQDMKISEMKMKNKNTQLSFISAFHFSM